MYRTSTHFIKGQLPGLTLRELLLLYRDELENEGAGNISVEGEAVLFSNTGLAFGLRSYGKFDSFSTGEIRITETGTEYLVDFSADRQGQLTLPAIIISAIAMIFTFVKGFDLFFLLFATVIFGLMVAGHIVHTAITFPIYFVHLRNRIEQHIAAYK